MDACTMTKHPDKCGHFDRWLSHVNSSCGETPKEKHCPEHDKIWDNFEGCVGLVLSRLHGDATHDYKMWVNFETQCQPNGLTDKEMKKVEEQELLYFLLCEVEKQLETLRPLPAMKEAMGLCQKSHDVCEKQHYIEMAVTRIVKELVALIGIFYKCLFSVTELHKIPAGTFAPYQKHLNVFSAWFKLRCVL